MMLMQRNKVPTELLTIISIRDEVIAMSNIVRCYMRLIGTNANARKIYGK